MAEQLYWYNNAIIYGLDIGVFKDGNGDGYGDFKGATEKLDYLQDLGVNCIWLLPFYESSERDNGYDVEDYYGINRNFGSVDDFMQFRKEAEKRNIRILIDLVVNHTSDEHPWFKIASENKNSKYYNFYVWNSSPPVVTEANIFQGSTWKYCSTIDEYYHHKFYKFEPDLNIVNPEVQEAIKDIIRYWMDFGISGFRLDAATHLFEMFRARGDRTPGKVMEDFHKYLTSLKEDAFFLAEADVKGSKIEEYVGEGNRMSMLFNFLLNNSLFLSLARGKAAPVRERLKALPEFPSNVKWANFVRNLDELDLEQLSEAERNEVFHAFAPDKRMQVYGRGIRRRFAPMVSANPKLSKMVYNLLFALPGVPVIMYGDEIGMGDNLVYKGRRAVRTPMQWNTSKNGGFSSAPLDEIEIKPISEGIFSYHFVNVEDQLKDKDSLLNAIKGFIEVRKKIAQLLHQGMEVLDLGHEAVLGLSYQDEVLVFLNFSKEAQTLEVDFDLSQYRTLLEDSSFGENNENDELNLRGFGYRWLRKKD